MPRRRKVPARTGEVERQSDRTESDAEDLFLKAVREAGFPEPICNYRFFPERMWRGDFAWLAPAGNQIKGVIFEVEGFGRHQRYVGYKNDCEKYSTAASQGWLVLRATTAQAKQPDCLELLFDALLLAKIINK